VLNLVLFAEQFCSFCSSAIETLGIWQPFSSSPFMVWQSWAEGHVPVDTAGFPQAPWKHLIGSLPPLRRKLRMALPCIGLDALGVGLKALGWHDFELTYACDVDPKLVAGLLAAHGPIGLGGPGVAIGHSVGNLLLMDVRSWERVDIVVAGPPCPPWSSIGMRRSAADPRAQVFQKVTECIIHQGQLGCYGFIVEMVTGMDRRSRSCRGETYYAAWREQLHQEAPMFMVYCWHMETSDYLPQHRARLYTVGIHRDALLGRHVSPPLPPLVRPVKLEAMLHKGLRRIDEDSLSPQHRANLAAAKLLARQRQSKSGAIGLGAPMVCIAVDRCPEKTWGLPIRFDGLVCTLRTCNEMIWLYKDGRNGVEWSRCLHPVERLTLQGFPAELAECFSKIDLLRVSGNSFSVPVVAAVFKQWLSVIATPCVLGVMAVPLPLKLKPAPEAAAEQLKKRLRANTHRELIGVLDCCLIDLFASTSGAHRSREHLDLRPMPMLCRALE